MIQSSDLDTEGMTFTAQAGYPCDLQRSWPFTAEAMYPCLSWACIMLGTSDIRRPATSSRWLEMSWPKIGTSPSATTMPTRLWLYYHMSRIAWHRYHVTAIKQERSRGQQPVGFLVWWVRPLKMITWYVGHVTSAMMDNLRNDFKVHLQKYTDNFCFTEVCYVLISEASFTNMV